MVAAAARPGVLPHCLTGGPNAGWSACPARAEGRIHSPHLTEPRGAQLKAHPPHNPLFPPLPQDKLPLKRPVDAFLPWLLSSVRQLSHPFSPHIVLWSLYLVAATTCLLRAMARRPRGGAPPTRHKAPKQPRGDQGEKNGQLRRKEGREAEERGEGRSRGAADGEGPRGTKRRK